MPSALRYEIHVDGEYAGQAHYLLHKGRVVFDHTAVDDAFAGRGLASELARKALDDVRARGLKVVALCPYMTGWLAKHPDYQDLVDQELTDEIESGA